MPVNPIVAQSAGQAANTVLGMGIGMATAKWNDKRQVNQQKKLQALQIAGDKELTDYNQMKALQMWKDTSYGPQKEQMKAAGINPALMYGMGGGGGQTANVAQGNVSGGNAPAGGGEIGMGIQTAMQLKLLQAQKENIEADTENKKAQTSQAGATTQKTETENDILSIERDFKTEGYQASISKLKSETNKALSEANSAYFQNIVDQNTWSSKIDAIVADATGVALRNDQTKAATNLTEAQTSEVGAKISQIYKMLAQKDRELDQRDQDILINQTKNELIKLGIVAGAATQIAGSLIHVLTK